MVYLVQTLFVVALCVQADGRTGVNKRTQQRLTNVEHRLDTVTADISVFRLDINDIWDTMDMFNQTCCQIEDIRLEKTVETDEKESSKSNERLVKRIYTAFQSEKKLVRENMAKLDKGIKQFESDIELKLSQWNEIEKQRQRKLDDKLERTEQKLDNRVNGLDADMISLFTKTEQQLYNLTTTFATKVNSLETDLAKCHQLEDENKQCQSINTDKAEEIKELKLKLQEVDIINIQLQDTIKHLKKKCPIGWYRNKLSCYYLSTFRATWHNSMNWCRTNGGYLVEYEDRAELKLVVDLAKVSSDWSKSVWTGFWTGSDDVGHEANWKWSNSGQRLKFRNWKSQQPDNGSGTEHCMVTLVNLNGQWNDEQCYVAYKFVCEKIL